VGGQGGVRCYEGEGVGVGGRARGGALLGPAASTEAASSRRPLLCRCRMLGLSPVSPKVAFSREEDTKPRDRSEGAGGQGGAGAGQGLTSLPPAAEGPWAS
jgi:hypothetical protein